jgi:hypothetical protein
MTRIIVAICMISCFLLNASNAYRADTLSPKTKKAVAPPAEIKKPVEIGSSTETLKYQASKDSATVVKSEPTQTPAVPAAPEIKPVSEEIDTSIPTIAELDSIDSASTELAKVYGLKDIRQMREDAERLRHEARRLRAYAGKLDSESGRLEDDAENLMDRAHDAEDFADDVMEKTADSLEKMSTDSTADSTASVSKGPQAIIERQQAMIKQLHDNAQDLLRKSNQIAMKVRQMEEEADRRDDVADNLYEKAEDLDPTPYSRRFPWGIGFSFRLSSIGPYNDNDPHLLFMPGLLVSYGINDFLTIGLHDIGFYSIQTIKGNRYAISASPVAEFSATLAKRIQLGGGIGVQVQGRFGSDRENQGAVAPFLTVFNRTWAWKHGSLGPFVRLNWAAYGPQFTMSNYSGILPEKAVWSDIGFAMHFNF